MPIVDAAQFGRNMISKNRRNEKQSSNLMVQIVAVTTKLIQFFAVLQLSFEIRIIANGIKRLISNPRNVRRNNFNERIHKLDFQLRVSIEKFGRAKSVR